ncbi:TetR family transcriptional regulator [Prauserella marina]|uniref:DNA-binding transcriptional regulator, AcrR family n=1 Tax=Prauserella marina TaxID=530584 RepID=A0A222VM46_9PSEU|nr:TetR/AcrR family transcriptional regulator [Prauserella marina]ASR34833.1 TetR family transcriptional regulator [Prauserella marina]PWV85470.1 TetR family transcriptional regulator [Prauserella marina]SDC54046.1 DNA-binding transcriptional regulator, AcrR family [Prauserella marina]
MRSRREEYSESTRSALVDSAIALFTTRGYAGTSLDEIAKRTKVTKGALYHHFSGKQAVFEAAFDAVETDVKGRLEKILRGPEKPWDRALNGLREFISSCLDPAYQRIAIHEAPVVMGWQRWKEAEDRYSFGLIRSSLRDLIDAGEIMNVPVEVTSRLLFGALSSAATEIAGSADPEAVGRQVETVIISLLHQVRQPPPDSAE